MENKWNWKALASASGILLGVYLFLAGLFAAGNISFWWFNPQIFNLLASVYPGLSATLVGAVIGLIWGFVCGALCGAVIAGLYNWFSEKFE